MSRARCHKNTWLLPLQSAPVPSFLPRPAPFRASPFRYLPLHPNPLALLISAGQPLPADGGRSPRFAISSHPHPLRPIPSHPFPIRSFPARSTSFAHQCETATLADGEGIPVSLYAAALAAWISETNRPNLGRQSNMPHSSPVLAMMSTI